MIEKPNKPQDYPYCSKKLVMPYQHYEENTVPNLIPNESWQDRPKSFRPAYKSIQHQKIDDNFMKLLCK